MKTTKILLLGLATAVTLTTAQSLRASDGNSQLGEIMQNRALAHSPRMIELYPELARINWGPIAAPKSDTGVSPLVKVEENQALANSPRMKEQFPELACSGQNSSTGLSKRTGVTGELTKAIRNQALANSPRMKELYPELEQRGNASENSVEIAPLK